MVLGEHLPERVATSREYNFVNFDFLMIIAD